MPVVYKDLDALLDALLAVKDGQIITLAKGLWTPTTRRLLKANRLAYLLLKEGPTTVKVKVAELPNKPYRIRLSWYGHSYDVAVVAKNKKHALRKVASIIAKEINMSPSYVYLKLFQLAEIEEGRVA